MKKKKKYEKPRIEFHDLQLKEEIANTCWGGHIKKNGKGSTWFYDTKGEGYVSFQINSDSCALSLANVTFYHKNGTVGSITQDQINELNAALAASGGNEGTNFKGEDTGLFPNNPDSRWS